MDMDNKEKHSEYEQPEKDARRAEVAQEGIKATDVVRKAERRVKQARVYAEKERRKRRAEISSRVFTIAVFVVLGIALSVCCALLIIGRT